VTIEIFITLMFLMASIWVVFWAEKAKNPVGTVHMLFFVIFVTVLHLAGLFGDHERRLELSYYLLAHIVAFGYLALFALGMLCMREKRLAPSRERIFRTAVEFSNIWLIAAFSAWLIVKVYLVSKYGVSAFSLLRNMAGKDAVLHFYAWWETPLEFYATAFAVGACGVFVIKATLEKGFWRKHWLVTMAFTAFTAVYVGTHSSIVGPRRFMLLLVLVGLVTIAWRDKKRVSKFVMSKWRISLVAVIFLLGAAGYYQSIRNNFFQPDIGEQLLSGDPLTFAQGVAQAMVPVPSSERVSAPSKYFREGPLSIVYEVIQKRGDGNPGTGGAITVNAFKSVIPRIIVGESKQDINADDFLNGQMGIAPAGPYLRSDVATSLLAIFLADFGYLGVLLAPMVMLFSLTMFAYIPRKGLLASPLLILYFFSALMNLSANVEGSLVPILSTFRDAMILMLALLPFYLLRGLVLWRGPSLTRMQYRLRQQRGKMV